MSGDMSEKIFIEISKYMLEKDARRYVRKNANRSVRKISQTKMLKNYVKRNDNRNVE